MPSDKNGDFEVGYGRPPTHSRFKPGRSGNPAGRPKKGTKQDSASLLSQVANESVNVTVKGRSIKMTKRKAALVQLMNKAILGDYSAIKLAENLFAREDSRKAKEDKAEPVINFIISKEDADL